LLRWSPVASKMCTGAGRAPRGGHEHVLDEQQARMLEPPVARSALPHSSDAGETFRNRGGAAYDTHAAPHHLAQLATDAMVSVEAQLDRFGIAAHRPRRVVACKRATATAAKDDRLEQRVAGEAIGAMRARARCFSDRPKTWKARPPIEIHRDAAHVIVGCCRDWNRVSPQIESVLAACAVRARKCGCDIVDVEPSGIER